MNEKAEKQELTFDQLKETVSHLRENQMIEIELELDVEKARGKNDGR